MAKRKNLKVIITTARRLDVLKFKDILDEEESEDNPNPIKWSTIWIDNYKIPLSLRSLLPPVWVKYLEDIKLFKYTPRIYYLEKATYNYLDKAVETVFSIHNLSKGDGDIQIFFTGTQEVADFIEKFEVIIWNDSLF